MLDVGRAQTLVLLRIDVPLALLRGPFVLVDLQGAIYAFNEPQLVVAIEYLEVLYQARFLPMGAQESMSQTVKRTNPHAPERMTHQGFDSITHLSRRLVGKGNGQ